jgi:hypothetical protein
VAAYLGLFFIVVILYAPAWLGLLLMHRRVITRALRALLARTVALRPRRSWPRRDRLIEMSYRLATQPGWGRRCGSGPPSTRLAGAWIVAALMLPRVARFARPAARRSLDRASAGGAR